MDDVTFIIDSNLQFFSQKLIPHNVHKYSIY